jgi:hypothetical protein
VTDEDLGQVVSLHQADLHSGRVADLSELSAEQAATALMAAFQSTGYAEAFDVFEVERTRDLVRRDCRRRRLKVQTIGVNGRIVVMDESRHEHWLETPAGQAYKNRADQAALSAMSALAPSGPRRLPPRPAGS